MESLETFLIFICILIIVRLASSLLNISLEINKGGYKKIVLKVLFNDVLAT